MPGGTIHSAQPWPHHGPLCVLQGDSPDPCCRLSHSQFLSLLYIRVSLALTDPIGVYEPAPFSLSQHSLSWVSQTLKAFNSGGRLVCPEQEGKSFALPEILASIGSEMIDPCPLGSYHLPYHLCVRGEDLCRADGGDTVGEQRGEAAAPNAKGSWKSHIYPGVCNERFCHGCGG